MAGEPGVSEALAVRVTGPEGAVDLVVPASLLVHELASEYARETGSAGRPLLFSLTGRSLPPEISLAGLGLQPGALVVATWGVPRPGRAGASSSGADPGRPSATVSAQGTAPGVVLWLGGAAILGLLAVAAATWGDPGARAREATAAVLAVAALAGLLSGGRYAAARAAVAPAFGGAATAAAVWRPEPEALPLVLGLGGLGACVAAALVRVRMDRDDEPLTVWMIAGGGLFVVAGAAGLLGLGPAVVWSVVLVLVLFAARVAPALVVDVPDQQLVDLERLAVTAWSARERVPGRRGRALVSPESVADLAARGARSLGAASLATALLSGLAAGLLLAGVDTPVDRVGARWLVLFAGAGLLLAARNQRHPVARWSLRTGGLVPLGAVAAGTLGAASPAALLAYAAAAGVAAVVLVVAAVATGRGWRSAWWARRAEVAESVCVAAAVAAAVVSTGLFRILWEFGSVRFGG